MENALVQKRNDWCQITKMILLGFTSAATLIYMVFLPSIRDPFDDWNITIAVCSAALIIVIATLIVLMILDKAKDYQLPLLMWNWFLISAIPVTVLLSSKYQKFAICAPVFVGAVILLNEFFRRSCSQINAASATHSISTITTQL